MSPKLDRRKNVIGANVHKGVVPGGFSHNFSGSGRVRKLRAQQLGSNAVAIKEAANAFLEKRGFRNHVSGFEAAAINYPRASR